MTVLESLLPIFLMIGVGAALTRLGFFTPDFLRHLNILAYWVGMPALLFAAVSTAEISGARPLRISAVILGATVVSLLVGFVVARLLKLPPTGLGTFVQSAFRGNLAFLAFPLSIYVFSRPGAPATTEEMTPVIALAIAPVMIIYAVLAVAILIASHHSLSRKGMRMFLGQVLINPHVLAIGAGLVFSIASLTTPGPVLATIKTIGGIAIPAALFGIGGTLATARLQENLRTAAAASLIKIALTPAVAWLVTRIIGMPSVDAAVAVMLCAAPTAAVSFVMATQLRGDPALASSSITLSTIGSIASLGVAITLIR